MSKTIDTSVLDARMADDEDTEMPEFIFDPETGEEIARVVYRSTDAWRGHYDLEMLNGWREVGDGTNCGSWDDTPPGTSNTECEALVDGLEAEHGNVMVVLLPTSNVFAMAFSVLAKGEAAEESSGETEETYDIVRHRFDGDNEVVRTGLTLAEAQAHCQRDDTHGDGWFDGYREGGS